MVATLVAKVQCYNRTWMEKHNTMREDKEIRETNDENVRNLM